jgi:transcriptional regulator of acetoin/glycerol metabolism
MAGLRQRVERVATTDFTALIEGESGTGKELVARQIHELSRRRRGPFVAVNCAAVVETLLEAELFGIEERTATGVRGRRGKFEHSDMGTLFLDEVSDLSLSAQAKLLRAVQDLAVERVGGTGTKRVNTRIVAATNRPLSDMVDKGPSADLYYRLTASKSACRRCGARFRHHRGALIPARHGHVRGLVRTLDALAPSLARQRARAQRVIERAVPSPESDRIELDDLPPQVRGGMPRCWRRHWRTETMRARGSRYARLVFERVAGTSATPAGCSTSLSPAGVSRYATKDSSGSAKQVPAWARVRAAAPTTARRE